MLKTHLFPRLPSLKRCNTRGNFPFNYYKYSPRIYPDGLPTGYIPLDYSLGRKTYNNLYKYIRRGTVRGVIFKDHKYNKWRYAVKPEDIKSRSNKIKDPYQDALIKLKDLDAQTYLTINQAAKLTGIDWYTLEINVWHDQLFAYIPAPETYKELKLHPNTKRIIKVEDLRLWLILVKSGEIWLFRRHRIKDPRSRSNEAKKLSVRKCYQRYQDRRQIALGTYGNWRPKPQTKK